MSISERPATASAVSAPRAPGSRQAGVANAHPGNRPKAICEPGLSRRYRSRKSQTPLATREGTVLKYFPTKILLLLAVKQQTSRKSRTGCDAFELVIPTANSGCGGDGSLHRLLGRQSRSLPVGVLDGGNGGGRRYPNGAYFGDTEVAQGGVRISLLQSRNSCGTGCESPADAVATTGNSDPFRGARHHLTTVGNPDDGMAERSRDRRLLIGSLIDAWTLKLAAARRTDSWPIVSMRTFV